MWQPPPLAHAAEVGNGPAEVNLAICAAGDTQTDSFIPDCSYTYLTKVAAPSYTYITSQGAVAWKGTAAGSALSFPASAQTWPTLTNLFLGANSTTTPKQITATIDATGFNGDTDLVLPALGAGKFWDKSTFLADGVIRVASSGPSYASWATSMGLTGEAALPGATPYNDGITNLLRYAMNLPAASAEAFALTAHSNLVVATGTQDFVMEYRKRKGMTDVTLVVQTSTDLLTWVDATAGTTTQLTDPDADTELYRYTQSVDGTPRYFRVQATLVP